MLSGTTLNLRWRILMLMIRNYFGNIGPLRGRWRSCVLSRRPWNIMTIIRMQVWRFWWRTIWRNDILSFKLFIFIVFIYRFFFHCMIPYSMTSCGLSLFFSVLSCRLLISLRRCQSRNLALLRSRSLWNDTFPVFFINHVLVRISLHLGILRIVALNIILP